MTLPPCSDHATLSPASLCFPAARSAPVPYPGEDHWNPFQCMAPFVSLGQPGRLVSISHLGKGKLRQNGAYSPAQPRRAPPAPREPSAPKPGPAESTGREVPRPRQPAAHSPPPQPSTSGCRARAPQPPPRSRPCRRLPARYSAKRRGTEQRAAIRGTVGYVRCRSIDHSPPGAPPPRLRQAFGLR